MNGWSDERVLLDTSDTCQDEHMNGLQPSTAGNGSISNETYSHDMIQPLLQRDEQEWTFTIPEKLPLPMQGIPETVNDNSYSDTIPDGITTECNLLDGNLLDGSLTGSSPDELPFFSHGETHCTSEHFVPYNHYPFITVNEPTDGLPEVTEFMKTMHCFCLPRPPILDVFIKQYFLHVHPNLPILDEGEFMEVYSNRASNGVGIPLFLIQAMLVAASTVCSYRGHQYRKCRSH